ncbi:unnamed protein product [Medioppia subpectinata]|uniref:lysozyme n=1 Tax=Medioppia subpectinata TaxID=1979941 RepID=A0A7R9L176_9ACAR|nr:unnamed protein product [Medioppia subpectinata]CAG2113314.1 unnamed protein product [Medioppia subpectinata]
MGMCIMFWESGLDTKAHRIGNFDGSSNYGILQISDLMWCQSNGRKNNTNFCDSSCDKFRDSDITDDIKCGLLIYKLQGFDAWGSRCRSENTHYTEGCSSSKTSVPKDTKPENANKNPSIKDTKKVQKPPKTSQLVKQLVQMSKQSMNIPESMFRGISRRSIESPKPTQKVQNKVNNKTTKRAAKSQESAKEGFVNPKPTQKVQNKVNNKTTKRAAKSQVINGNKNKIVRSRQKRGLLGQDSINPFEDARIFVFNPLCCFNWKAAEVEWSNAKNWYSKPHTHHIHCEITLFIIDLLIVSFRARDIRTSVG